MRRGNLIAFTRSIAILGYTLRIPIHFLESRIYLTVDPGNTLQADQNVDGGEKTNVDSTEMSGMVWAGSKQENSSTCYVHKAGSSIVIPSSSLQGMHSANKEASCSWFACLFVLVR